MSSKTIDGITFCKSNRQGKKYRAEIPARLWNKYRPDERVNTVKVIHFGALGYQHYHDVIGYYRSLDHKDKERRRRYRARHSGSTNKKGKPAYKVKYSPSYLAYYYLW